MINIKLLTIDSILIDFLHGPASTKEINSYSKGINLTIEEHKVTALIGGNGSGKTTLFNAISGFLKTNSGGIFFNKNGKAEEITNKAPYIIAQYGIGRMFQDNHIFQDLTVLENMLVADAERFGENPIEPFLFYRRTYENEESRVLKAKEKLNSLFGHSSELIKKLNEKANTLSYGQQRLLGLARLLMGDYKLLLLDEPTSGASPQQINNIKELIRYFVQKLNKTVFLIEHNMQFVLDVADYCYFMDNGLIKLDDTPERVLRNSEVRMDYLGV